MDKNKKINRLVSSVLFGLITINTVMAADTSHPKLVIGIVVDQLRTDYIDYLRDYFGEKGFKRLMKDGVYLKDVDFKVEGLDAATATALLYTGSYPVATGVPSSYIYDAETGRSQPALLDGSALGNFTDDAYSPASLRLSTIGDEVVMSGNGLTRVYAFSPDAQQSIIMAGHAGTSACWINESNGNWATTTYYKAFPSAVSLRNYNNSLSSRLDTIVWRPMLSAEKYPSYTRGKKSADFRHSFPRSTRDVYRMYEASPMVNAEVTDVAIDCIRSLKLGSESTGAPEMISVGYTAAPYPYSSGENRNKEIEDTYLRLDAQIGRLLDAADQAVGAGNAVIVLTSTGYYKENSEPDAKFHIPTGEFSAKRAKSLLNSYFAAQYGNGDYVKGFVNGHLYLNHNLLDEKKLNVSDIAGAARQFLCRMSGIRDAVTIDDILTSATPRNQMLRNIIDPKHSGDVIIFTAPGWKLVDDIEYPPVEKYMSETPVLTPAFIVAPGLGSREIGSTVDATALAPTIAGLLHIRSPNGAVSKPINLTK